jgi:hypothetical protein
MCEEKVLLLVADALLSFCCCCCCHCWVKGFKTRACVDAAFVSFSFETGKASLKAGSESRQKGGD